MAISNLSSRLSTRLYNNTRTETSRSFGTRQTGTRQTGTRQTGTRKTDRQSTNGLRKPKSHAVESDESETDEEEIEYQKHYGELDVAPEYTQISKLIRFAKAANQTGTVLALLALNDLIVSDSEKLWLLRLGGVQLLVNLLRVEDQRCKVSHMNYNDIFAAKIKSFERSLSAWIQYMPEIQITSLKVLMNITTHVFVVDEVIKLSGVQRLIDMIESGFDKLFKTPFNQQELQLVLHILGNLSIARRVKRIIREYDGFPILIPFLTIDVTMYLQKVLEQNPGCKEKSFKQLPKKASSDQKQRIKLKNRETVSLGKCMLKEKYVYTLQNLHLAAIVLWKSCENKRNIVFILNENITQLLTSMLQLQITEIDQPIIGIINQCCINEEFCKDALADGLMYHCIRTLKYQDNTVTMKIIAAQTIYKCIEHEPQARVELRLLSGLMALMVMVESAIKHKEIHILKTALCTFWFSLKDDKLSCEWFGKEEYLKKIMDLIRETHENQVIVYCFGILQEYMMMCKKCKALIEDDITKIFIDKLQHTDVSILVAVNNAVKVAAEMDELRENMIKNDTLRLTWSNLKSKHSEVAASSADAIYNLIVETEEIADIMRSFVGGLELLVKLLQSTNNKVLAAVCCVISRVALDRENQTILDDYGILNTLVNLCKNKNNNVRKALSRCIVSYSVNERFQLSLRPAIVHLGFWLESKDDKVKYEATHALFKLSFNQENCMLMYEYGVVKYLINLIRSDDERLQEASARCLKNIRTTVMGATKENK